jgi:hypothetical protein
MNTYVKLEPHELTQYIANERVIHWSEERMEGDGWTLVRVSHSERDIGAVDSFIDMARIMDAEVELVSQTINSAVFRMKKPDYLPPDEPANDKEVSTNDGGKHTIQ